MTGHELLIQEKFKLESKDDKEIIYKSSCGIVLTFYKTKTKNWNCKISGVKKGYSYDVFNAIATMTKQLDKLEAIKHDEQKKALKTS